MKIAILNGSPKKETSVTMQYMNFLEKSFSNHEFTYIHASFYCKKMENDEGYFNEVMEQIKHSDAVIWAFPLYFLLVQSQYKRFIELIFERNMEHIFQKKYTASLSTSIHFFDHTAHNYIRAVSDDLNMKYVDFYPAKMHDLTEKKNHPSLFFFMKKLERHFNQGLPTPRANHPVREETFVYDPRKGGDISATGKRAVIVADINHSRPNVKTMAEKAAAQFDNAKIVNLRSIKTGPCQGCLKCGFDNVCAYTGKDEFINVLDNTILKADIIIFAIGMHDRYFSHVWQRYLERTFVHTHQTMLKGKQIAFLVSGPFSQNQNAREILQGYIETMKANLITFITDECGSSSDLDAMIGNMAIELTDGAAANIVRPHTFLGDGGIKIFRDDIAGGLRFVFQGDHKYYKKHRYYDFPHKKRLQSFAITVLTLVSKIPPLRKKIRKDIKTGMLRPYQKTLREAKSQEN